MKKLLFMVMACYAVTSSAQSGDYVHLSNDSVVYANRVILRANIAGNLQVRADSRQIPINQIKFLNNREGFFAGTNKPSLIRSFSFAERVIEGRINVFQAIPDDLFTRDRWERQEDVRQSPLTASMYYNKGYGNLKNVSYENLMLDMADHPESLDFLKAYKKKLKTSKTLYISAGASLIAGMISLIATGSDGHINGSGKLNSFTPAVILSGIGTGLAVGGVYTQLTARQQLEGAIDAYNR